MRKGWIGENRFKESTEMMTLLIDNGHSADGFIHVAEVPEGAVEVVGIVSNIRVFDSIEGDILVPLITTHADGKHIVGMPKKLIGKKVKVLIWEDV